MGMLLRHSHSAKQQLESTAFHERETDEFWLHGIDMLDFLLATHLMGATHFTYMVPEKGCPGRFSKINAPFCESVIEQCEKQEGVTDKGQTEYWCYFNEG
eukprot:g51583.t1